MAKYLQNSSDIQINEIGDNLQFEIVKSQLLDLIDRGDTRFYGNGATGGEFDHLLTVDEMPSHSHTTSEEGYGFTISNSQITLANGNDQYSNNAVRSNTGSTGGGLGHNNMPPFLAVYMWKRTE